MSQSSLLFIFIDSFIINNIVLMVFLGICPFLGVSGKLDTAARMGAAVIFVLLVSSSIT
ncbi:MAG: electron transport complex subunit A, partial [Candidatus Hydrogenedentes bacterium]|nr:electron transport complex subunit A [Candidatus Hydrogenedentota bacterium]